jgi:hypothetical protein
MGAVSEGSGFTPRSFWSIWRTEAAVLRRDVTVNLWRRRMQIFKHVTSAYREARLRLDWFHLGYTTVNAYSDRERVPLIY